jgi:hypothetical protein
MTFFGRGARHGYHLPVFAGATSPIIRQPFGVLSGSPGGAQEASGSALVSALNFSDVDLRRG